MTNSLTDPKGDLVERLRASNIEYSQNEQHALLALTHHIINPELNEFTGQTAKVVLDIMARHEGQRREAASALTAQSAELASLRVERDEAREGGTPEAKRLLNRLAAANDRADYYKGRDEAGAEMEQEAIARAEAAEQRVAELEGARPFDFFAHLARQREWSGKTFGPGDRAKGVVDHIRKELLEIEADPGDLKEWIDVVILALDGAWRAGFSPDQIVAQLIATQARNEARVWPDWRVAPADKAIEHVRSALNQEPTAETAPGSRGEQR